MVIITIAALLQTPALLSKMGQGLSSTRDVERVKGTVMQPWRLPILPIASDMSEGIQQTSEQV